MTALLKHFYDIVKWWSGLLSFSEMLAFLPISQDGILLHLPVLVLSVVFQQILLFSCSHCIQVIFNKKINFYFFFKYMGYKDLEMPTFFNHFLFFIINNYFNIFTRSQLQKTVCDSMINGKHLKQENWKQTCVISSV